MEPQLYRKILVTESVKGIILTKEQIDLVKKMVAKPADWYELKVGLGKTSIVFPLVLMILIENGKFPAAVVKDEMLPQNLESLDRSTREIKEKAGIEFSFNINDPISTMGLIEQYHRLLQVKANKGYPITSISSIIAIDQKMQLLTEELNKKIDGLTENQEYKQIILDVFNGSFKSIDPSNFKHVEPLLKKALEWDSDQKNLYYLGKIREILSLLIIDEADDILNVVCENNVGRGDPVPLDVNVQQTMDHMMRVIFVSGNAIIAKFREELKKGQQASLDSLTVKTVIMPTLVDEMLKDQEYRQFIGDFKEVKQQDLVDHICKVFEKGKAPQEPNIKSRAAKEKLGALKHIIQASLKIAIKQNPGIDTGVKKSDGYQIGPQVSGQEKEGTVFGDEFDLVVNHYLFYGVQLPHRFPNQKEGEGFVEKSLLQMRDKNPKIYEEWEKEAQIQGISIISYLNKPEHLSKRLDFLRLQLFDEKRLKRFGRQIVINRQHIQYGRTLGGMTGTCNKDSLPAVKTKDSQAVDSKKVHAQVILEAGILEIPEVKIVADEASQVLGKMAETANDFKNKAVINQGFDLKQGDSRAVVAEIRERAPERTFIYVDSTTRKFHMWKKGENTPHTVSKRDLDELYLDKEFRQSACFYFGPPDTRGTDFKIPPGKGVAFISPKCSMDDFVQTLGRMRKASDTHSMDFYISEGVVKRISGRHKIDKDNILDYGHLVDDIARQDMEERVGANLKTVREAMCGVTNTGTRNLLFGHQNELDDPSYKPLQISRNFMKLFEMLDGIRGKYSMCRVLINKEAVALIIGQEYHYMNKQTPFVASGMKIWEAIYAMASELVCGHSLILDQKMEDYDEKAFLDDDFRAKLVTAKWLLGMSEFTDQEKPILKKILEQIETNSVLKAKQEFFIDRFGTKEQRELIRTLLRGH